MTQRKSAKALNKLAGIPTTQSTPMPQDRYMVEDALRTIAKAEEHKRNKPLMREVKKLAKQQVKAVC